MKTASISALKAKLSEYIEKVRKGNDGLLVTDHGKPIALITPVDYGDDDQEIAEMVRAGIIRPGKGRIRDSLLKPSRAKDPQGLVLKALLEERDQGR